MKKTFIYLFPLVALFLLFACNKPAQVRSVETESIAIDATLDNIEDSDYIAVLAEKTALLDKELDVVIGYAPEDMCVRRPESNMVNWTADALLNKAKQYFDGRVDMSLVNIGGVRCDWKKGNITRRHIFELMPFNNELVVLTLRGEDLLELCQVMAEVGGEGVSGLRMQAEDKQLIAATIDGDNIVPEAYYTVATSDYLAGGKDKLTPLCQAVERWDSNRLIRDLYMEYATEQGQIVASVDGRMEVR